MKNWGQSLNYVWNESSDIGEGHNAKVYKGAHKKTGEEVAIKIFKNPMMDLRERIPEKEMDMMRKLSHKNVVKLLPTEAIETDQNGTIIVMELCACSVQDVLDEPQNKFGLPEEEVMLLLEHLTAAIKHLRDKKLVHRDLKPKNIMKSISENGQTIYKLADFGTARELEDSKPFKTICGTKEYVHPSIYNAIGKPKNSEFSANSDLWSIGATLYHVSTGKVPFCIGYGLKNDEKNLFKMLTSKKTGVISCEKRSENSPIEWSTELPEHCQLSVGLKMLITPLISALLEVNQEKTWSFDRFFNEVALILRKIVVHVFYMNRPSSLRVFVEPDAQVVDLREGILQQTKVPLEQQILLFNNECLERKVTSCCTAKEFPITTEQNPVLLYNLEEVDVQLPRQQKLHEFLPKNHEKFAETAVIISWEYTHRINGFTYLDIQFKNAVNQYHEMLLTKIKCLSNKRNHLMKYIDAEEDALIIRIVNRSAEPNNPAVTLFLNKLRTTKNNFGGINEAIDLIYKQYVGEHALNEKWHSMTHAIKCPCRTRAVEKAKYRNDKLDELLKSLANVCKVAENSEFDKGIHALEIIKIENHTKCIKALLLDDVQPAVNQMSECMADWYKLAQTVYLKITILNKNLKDCKDDLYKARKEAMNYLTKMMKDSDTLLRDSAEVIKSYELLK